MDGIYARQSVDKKDSISIETQIDLCMREVGAGRQYEVYKDKGYSGSNIDRPAFQELLRDIKSGKIDRLIVYRLDRMSRSLLDFANLIDFLDKHKASFVSTQEKFDTGTPMGRAMLSITMVFAQLERETIQIRIRDNYYSRGEKGMYLGGPPPYGFGKTETMKDGKKFKYLIPDEEHAGVVRNMYQWYTEENLTLGEVARRLNSYGFLSQKGKPWNSSRVSLTLRNPIYAMSDSTVYDYYAAKGCHIAHDADMFIGTNGCYLYGKRKSNERKYTSVSEHTLSLAPSEGVVDPTTFLACQARLDANIQLDNSSWGNKTWLTGLIKCASCGYSLIPKSGNNGRYNYFYCSGQINHCCDVSGKIRTVDEAEALIQSELFKVVERYGDLVVEQQESDSLELRSLRAQVSSIDAQIEKLIDTLTGSEEVTAAYLNSRIAKLDSQKQELQCRCDELAASKSKVSEKQLYSLFDDWPTLNNRQKNSLATQFVSQIRISPDYTEIVWKHNFQPSIT